MRIKQTELNGLATIYIRIKNYWTVAFLVSNTVHHQIYKTLFLFFLIISAFRNSVGKSKNVNYF